MRAWAPNTPRSPPYQKAGLFSRFSAPPKDENATKEEIEAKVKALTEVSHKMAEQMYKQEGQGEPAQGAKKADDDVIDAEIE